MGGTPEAGEFARSNLVRAIATVLNNPWQPAIIESASMDIELRYARDILRLRGADLLESEIDAGAPARIRLTLVPYSGPDVTRVVSVPASPRTWRVRPSIWRSSPATARSETCSRPTLLDSR